MAQTTFFEGQEVEIAPLSEMFGAWRKGKLLGVATRGDHWVVGFEDGSRSVCHVSGIGEEDTNGTDAKA